jgi:hypothetical protein
MFGRSHVLKPDTSIEDSFDRTDACANSSGVAIVASLLEALASGNTSLKYLGIRQTLIDALP